MRVAELVAVAGVLAVVADLKLGGGRRRRARTTNVRTTSIYSQQTCASLMNVV